MDYNIILKNLRTNKNQTVYEINKLDKSKSDELNDAKRLIEEKYSGLKQTHFSDLDRKSVEIHNYCKLIENNSIMDSDIFDVITELISIFEGETYVLKKLRYHKDESTPSCHWETFMIMSKNTFENIKNPNYISERYFYHLLKNGLAIKIIDDWSIIKLPNEFSFYKTDDMLRLNQQISFKGFPYVKQFVDYVINYRIENSVEELTKEDMQKLKDEFILLNLANICNNYKFKAEQRIKETTENIINECEHKQMVLMRTVKKINKKNN